MQRPRRSSRSRTDVRVLGAIAAGGALGAPARYGVALLLPAGGDTFPWATFAVNVSGSFLLGWLLTALIERYPPTRYVRPFLATGLLGGFTTYSTFAVETDLLVRNGRAAVAAAYVAASLLGGVAAAWSGIVAARLAPVWSRRAGGRS